MEFPILGLVDNDAMLYVFENKDPFERTSEELYKRGVLPNERYVDLKGQIYRVKSIKNLGYSGLWGFHPLLKGRQIKIKTVFFSEIDNMELSELKNLIISQVDKKKAFWASAWDIDELKERINNSITFKEVIELLK